MNTPDSPFVLGKPIKEPAHFFGRDSELRALFESVRNMQPVAMVGEHRCGNTSLLYQMQNPSIQERYLSDADRAGLLFTFANAQLAAEGPESFFRRIARALKRVDDDADMDFDGDVDQFWLEDYLENLADRHKRLVLLLDEFEVLSTFQTSFWEWFRGLITEYDMSIVVATRVELGEFRDEWGTGSPFFNMFRSIYISAFSPAEVEAFVTAAGQASGVNFDPVRAAINDLSGGFPYYLQVVASLFYDRALGGEPLTGDEQQVLAVTREFESRVESHYEDIWTKLPVAERDALSWLAVGSQPEGPASSAFRGALPILKRRGYLSDGRIFSSAFRDYVRRQIPRIELIPESGSLRIERRPVDLPPKEYTLLRFFSEHAGEVVTKDEIASAVWPEYESDQIGVTDAMIQKTISRLRKEVDLPEGSPFQHIESMRGQGYRYQNASVHEVYRRASE